MNVSGSASASAALQGVQGSDDKRVNLQIAILRKALDAQESEAATLVNQMLGKGQVVDLRV